MEALLDAKKLGQLIQKLLPYYTDPLDFNRLKDTQGLPFKSPSVVHRAASRTMQDWMGIPATLNRIASTMETESTAWLDLLSGSYTIEANPIPPHIRSGIVSVMQASLFLLRPGRNWQTQ